MAQFFEQIIQSINNSEIRIALEQLFGIMGVGRGSQAGNPGFVGNITGNVTGDVLGDVVGDLTGDVTADVVKASGITYTDQTTDLDGVVLNNFITLHADDAVVTLTNLELQLGAMYTFYCSRGDEATTVVLKTPATFDGINNKASFEEEDAISVFATAAGKFHILENDGVVLSSV